MLPAAARHGSILLAVETLKFLGRLQLIVMCGENKKLCGSLEAGGHRHMRITNGFVESPADHYRAADLIVGKAGG